MKALPLYGWSYTLDFHDAFVALAREHDVPLVRTLWPPSWAVTSCSIWPYLEAAVRSTAA